MSEQNPTNQASNADQSELDSLRKRLGKLEAIVRSIGERDSAIVQRLDEIENRVEVIESDPPAALRAAIQELDGRFKRRMTKITEAQAAAMKHAKG